MYLVPSRALAGEVEAKLRSELGSDMTITALYGGADWGIPDGWFPGCQPTVVIETLQKADALMPKLRPILDARIRLIIVDVSTPGVPDAKDKNPLKNRRHNNCPP